MPRETDNGPWAKSAVKEFVRAVRKDLGPAWEYMVPEVRRAFIHKAAFSIVRSQHAATVATEVMDWLVARMEAEAGLRED